MFLTATFKIIFRYLLIWRKVIFALSIGISINTFIYLFVIKYTNNYGDNLNLSSALILLYTHNHSIKTRDNICRGIRNGGHTVHFDKCPKKCEFSCRLEDFKKRSPLALLFFGEDFSWSFKLSDRNRTSYKQRWIFWSWEAPIHHPEYTKSHLTFNWTMTYRQDSDVVHSYGRYIFRNLSHTIVDHQFIDFYLSSRTNRSTFDVTKEFRFRQNRILWIVSNCKSRTKRTQIAKELKNYFPIDQYGRCSGSKKINNSEKLLFNYKYYLAFENARCRDYITEKSFYNALAHGSIPIVLGPAEENYKKILPPHSFIHVDHFNDLEHLADQLQHISTDFNTFSSYHQWRTDYRLITWKSNYYIDDLFCNLCIKLYSDTNPKSYRNLSKWLNQCA